MLSDKEIRSLYGKSVVISRKGAFTLIHLDRPSKATIRRRRREFDPVEFFCPDCPLCQLLKNSGIVVFDDSIYETDDDGLEE
jgi:hypothetical protein